MAQFILKRLLVLPFLVFGITTIVFFITHLLPGDPVLFLLSPSLPPELAHQLQHTFGLDKPLPVQYLFWLREIIQGNFGVSFTYHREILSVIGDALPYTISLAFSAIIVEIILGIVLALVAVRYHQTCIDHILSITGLVTYTLPTFWIAFILLQLFAVHFTLFPTSHIHSVNAESFSSVDFFSDYVYHLILPVATLAIPGAAGIARFLRTSLLNVLNEKYITVARSMGITENKIFYSYALPNALTPVITIAGLELGALMTGTLITENIFALPGMGRLIVTAIFSRDYPLIVGCTIIASVVFICANLCADIIHGVIDPRVTSAHNENV